VAAFIIGSAIPQIQTINGVVAAIGEIIHNSQPSLFNRNRQGIMQFTYTFPPLLRLGYDVISDAMVADEPYDPHLGRYQRIDSWNQWSRWKRASTTILQIRPTLMCSSGTLLRSMVFQTFQLSLVPSEHVYGWTGWALSSRILDVGLT
jgi:hypothetical protein